MSEQRFKKTATITARQWWQIGDHLAVVEYTDGGKPTGKGWVNTLEGGHIVTPGDWIATGVNGEHWPIKPDVFAKTYAPDGPDPRIATLEAQLAEARDELEIGRRREIQMIGAAISTRNWHDAENGYNQIRDRIDRLLTKFTLSKIGGNHD